MRHCVNTQSSVLAEYTPESYSPDQALLSQVEAVYSSGIMKHLNQAHQQRDRTLIVEGNQRPRTCL